MRRAPPHARTASIAERGGLGNAIKLRRGATACYEVTVMFASMEGWKVQVMW